MSYSSIAATAGAAASAQAGPSSQGQTSSARPAPALSSQSNRQSAAPSQQQLQFARSVILTFSLWPAMKLAVEEEWGGPESRDKADYLISVVCDFCDESAAALAASPACGAQAAPDEEDLEDLIEGYVSDEFNVRLEDGSVQYVARRLVALWKTIFLEGGDQAANALNSLEEAFTTLRGSKVAVQRQSNGQDAEEDDSSESEGGSDADEQGGADGMDVDEPASNQPVVDEDGFTLVSRPGKKHR